MVDIITRTDLLAKIAANSELVIIDALPRSAFDRGHIPGAISIPSEQILARATELMPDRTTEIVAYCKNTPCRRSERAAERLESLGYTRVSDYSAGRDDWTGAGLLLDEGDTV
jgi:rhodanese-related sulfurtransferase